MPRIKESPKPLFACWLGGEAVARARRTFAQAGSPGCGPRRHLPDLFDGRSLVLRPVRPEDEPAYRVLFAKLHPDDIRFRFFDLIREPVHAELARYTQIDYEREMAFIAHRRDDNNEPEVLGVARVATAPDNITAEFAIVVRTDLTGKGLGSVLLKKLIEYCRERGTAQVIGHVLPDNKRMLSLAEKYGFQLTTKT